MMGDKKRTSAETSQICLTCNHWDIKNSAIGACEMLQQHTAAGYTCSFWQPFDPQAPEHRQQADIKQLADRLFKAIKAGKLNKIDIMSAQNFLGGSYSDASRALGNLKERGLIK